MDFTLSGTIDHDADGGTRVRLGTGASGACLRDGTLTVAVLGRVRFGDATIDTSFGTHEGRAKLQALAAAWRRQGPAIIDGCTGEFAVAVFDSATGRGMVATDRYGSVPVFFGSRGRSVAFATDPRVVCRELGLAPALSPDAIYAYFYFHMIPAPLSILDGVGRLDFGEALEFADGVARPRRYWTPVFDESAPFEFESARDAFREAVRQGVRESVEGVPEASLGCFLSGGTDSSTLAGMIGEVTGRPARTFSIGFEVDGYDERHYSRIAARHFKTEHTEYVVTPQDVLEGVHAVAKAYGQPFGNASAVPTYFCARLARRHGIARMIGGDGGDELFGGNERYATQWLFSLYGRLPGLLRRSAFEPLLIAAASRTDATLLRRARGYVEKANTPLPDRLHTYNLLLRLGAAAVFDPAFLARVDTAAPRALESRVWALSEGASQINRLLAYDFKFTLADNDLPKVTTMCHAAGVDVSFPLLCQAVTDLSLRLPPGQKLRGRRLRHFFKEALRGFLPDEILAKSKHGFGMPFGEWMLAQPELRELAIDSSRDLAERGIVSHAFVDPLLQSVRTGHAGYLGTMFWLLMTLELWLKAQPADLHVEGRAPAPVTA